MLHSQVHVWAMRVLLGWRCIRDANGCLYDLQDAFDVQGYRERRWPVCRCRTAMF